LCLRASSGTVTIQLCEGSDIELGILFRTTAHWLIGWVDVYHNPFKVWQNFQVTDIDAQLQNQDFVRLNYPDFTCPGSKPMPSIDVEWTTVSLQGYFATYLDTDSNYCDKTTYLNLIPSQSFWNYLRYRTSVRTVEMHANLCLLSLTTDREHFAWQRLQPRRWTNLIRVIEVWGQSLSKLNPKDLLTRIERATNHQRPSLVGIFGAWNNYGFANKNKDQWEFDIPKMLEHYKLTPLSPAAIAEFRQRGREFKERYGP
jgi:hypothetical protein